jgi:hypothetical protein
MEKRVGGVWDEGCWGQFVGVDFYGHCGICEVGGG